MTQAPTDIIPRNDFNPNAQVGNAVTMKRLIESQKASLTAILPKHITPDRLLKTLLVAVNRTPALLNCTQSSILETVNRAGELGLDLSGTLGEAYPVPYGQQCQLIIGYRGLAKLARQTGEVATISSDVVCKNDRFTFRKGGNAVCEWEPPIQGERGEVIGAFAHVQFKDGTQQFDYMTVSEINAIKTRSRSGKSGPWVSDWNEMAKKTVFRRLAKWLPLSAEKWANALEHDDRTTGLDLDVPTEPVAKGSAAVLDKLKAKEAATLPQDEPMIGTTPEGVQEPQTAAGWQDAANGELVGAIDELMTRWERVVEPKKGDKRPPMVRFADWVSTATKIGIESTAEISFEMVGKCHTVLDEIEGA